MAQPVPFHMQGTGYNQPMFPQGAPHQPGGVNQGGFNVGGMNVAANNNNMQWRGATGHQQPQQQPFGHPQPQLNQPPKIGTGFNPPQPDLINQFSNNPMAGYAMNQASTFFQAQSQRYMPGAYGFWGSLRYYFMVNNTYVISKLHMLLLPFRHKSWKRASATNFGPPSQGGTPASFIPPANDINAPDLYIPLMSFITYILIVGYVKGSSGEFSPDIIGEVGSYTLIIQLVEIAVIKFGLHLLHSSTSILDMVAYTGYKYVALAINMLVGILMGRMFYYICLLYTGSMIAYFMLNTLKGVVAEPSREGRKRRNYMLLGISILQLLLIWWKGHLEKISRENP